MASPRLLPAGTPWEYRVCGGKFSDVDPWPRGAGLRPASLLPQTLGRTPTSCQEPPFPVTINNTSCSTFPKCRPAMNPRHPALLGRRESQGPGVCLLPTATGAGSARAKDASPRAPPQRPVPLVPDPGRQAAPRGPRPAG
ncbi:hypothetical protein KIL84_009915 [Mauremys mutica]|uniref:Uncharacterized protein n=1 Tax=Mauremys mutica TaxID=74926 RepID=A0A9D4B682_9SAUR|nr:hypothetical protein KIL84_009915 [Mauremys mutica]